MLENEFIFFFNFGIWQIQSESPGKAIHCQDGTVHSAPHCAWLATQFMFQLEKYIVEMVCGQWLATQFEADATLEKVRRNAFFIQTLPGSIWPQNFSSLKKFILWKCSFEKNVVLVKMFIPWKCSSGPRFLTFCYSLLQLPYFSASGLNPQTQIMGLQVDNFAIWSKNQCETCAVHLEMAIS